MHVLSILLSLLPIAYVYTSYSVINTTIPSQHIVSNGKTAAAKMPYFFLKLNGGKL